MQFTYNDIISGNFDSKKVELDEIFTIIKMNYISDHPKIIHTKYHVWSSSQFRMSIIAFVSLMHNVIARFLQWLVNFSGLFSCTFRQTFLGVVYVLEEES